ncbi:hypothetical protein BaRGS_00034519 [Batillaria attramentaria]|uniref:Uncharacterized protein n=1 Tax=Batillaria attramentaria TaxID=370345 RepID=A0ABD0JIJ8_9CAEN
MTLKVSQLELAYFNPFPPYSARVRMYSAACLHTELLCVTVNNKGVSDCIKDVKQAETDQVSVFPFVSIYWSDAGSSSVRPLAYTGDTHRQKKKKIQLLLSTVTSVVLSTYDSHRHQRASPGALTLTRLPVLGAHQYEGLVDPGKDTSGYRFTFCQDLLDVLKQRSAQ